MHATPKASGPEPRGARGSWFLLVILPDGTIADAHPKVSANDTLGAAHVEDLCTQADIAELRDWVAGLFRLGHLEPLFIRVTADNGEPDRYWLRGLGSPHAGAAFVVAERCNENPADEVLVGPRDLRLDLQAHRVTVHQHELALTPIEFGLLQELLRRLGTVLSADALSEAVWGYPAGRSRNYVEAMVSRVRKKLASQGVTELIETVRGVGYVIRSNDG